MLRTLPPSSSSAIPELMRINNKTCPIRSVLWTNNDEKRKAAARDPINIYMSIFLLWIFKLERTSASKPRSTSELVIIKLAGHRYRIREIPKYNVKIIEERYLYSDIFL